LIPCDRFHDELILAALHAEVRGEELVRHLGECAACEARWRRLMTAGGLVRSLPRQLVPPELDGCVVASLHAGQREDRAVRTVRGLTRLVTPAELSSAVGDACGGKARAPAALDRLLAEDLADPGRSTARRASGRLRRLAAPPELARRLAADLRNETQGARDRWMSRGLLGLALAASLLVIVRLAQGPGGPQNAPPSLLALQIRTLESPEQLDPWARAIFDDFTGGASGAVPSSR
jgi:hypothetical protein